jgi:hypothetical protein
MLATEARSCARVATFSIASHSTSIVIEPSHSSAANNTLTAEAKRLASLPRRA